jgi:hypothetical protein
MGVPFAKLRDFRAKRVGYMGITRFESSRGKSA